MRDKWRPKPPPPPGRAGALVFVFVLLLCAALTALLFLLNPLAPAARLADQLASDATPTAIAARALDATPTAILASASPVPASSVHFWQLFLPFIHN